MSTWRTAGLNLHFWLNGNDDGRRGKLVLHLQLAEHWPPVYSIYVNYSNIAAKVLRNSLKTEQRTDAVRRGKPVVRYFYWVDGIMLAEGQKPTGEKDSKPS